MRCLAGINILSAEEAGFTPSTSVWVLWAWPERRLAVFRFFETFHAAESYILDHRPNVTCCVAYVQHELDAILDPDGLEAR